MLAPLLFEPGAVLQHWQVQRKDLEMLFGSYSSVRLLAVVQVAAAVAVVAEVAVGLAAAVDDTSLAMEVPGAAALLGTMPVEAAAAEMAVFGWLDEDLWHGTAPVKLLGEVLAWSGCETTIECLRHR